MSVHRGKADLATARALYRLLDVIDRSLNKDALEVDEIYNLACPASQIHYQHDPVVSRPVQRTGVISSRATLGGLHRHYARV